ncbi:glucoside xylosyltransferase 1-like [Anneissia japonica]|uniref:glucoside xylosyltransferase 1-like n=1 Tax=Anneissia japonica TaxID=1529436 RepID=UPI0014254C89|nr:glucoside xylosyltransferase 1-like [Anneissia japonica]
MWTVVSLHISFMFYIYRTRGCRRRCRTGLIISTFGLFILAGFYGLYIGGKGVHRDDTPLWDDHGKAGLPLGLGLPADLVANREHLRQEEQDHIYEHNVQNKPKINLERADQVDKNTRHVEQNANNKIPANDVYPGHDIPWKKFPDPIILEPQPIHALHVENRNDKIHPQQLRVPAPLGDGDRPPKANLVNEGEKVVKKMTAGVGNKKKRIDDHKIHLAVVCCGDRSEETLVMLKTAIINTQQKLYFHIFAEEDLKPGLAKMLTTWPAAFQAKMEFTLHSIQFPEGENPEEWKKVFKTCATQRLFLPDVLTDVDSLLYVDTDILFIRPLESIWSFFKEFNSTQLAALAPEHEIKNIGWYNRFARHPYYGMTGLNSGVMLMNLTRMRSFGWTEKIVPIYREYKLKITWGDQDLINILFHFHPDRVFVYPCEWNFRPDHCMYSNNCLRINDHGVSVIHGNRGVYHNEKQWPFRMIYEAFSNFQLGMTPEMHLIQPLQRKLSEPKSLNLYCGKTLIQPLISTLRKVFQDNSRS